MSDYFGLNQTRVLDSTNRNFEMLVYQKKKPPLSSELDLGGNLVSEKARDVANLVGPSGWTIVGTLKDNVLENSCLVGDVVTSSSYAANSIKLIAYDKGNIVNTLAAWVNGWKVLVQGSSSSDENNIITLNAPPTNGYRVDFVFLEVWRKLVYPSDTIYKYGNVLETNTMSNDLVDPSIGIETSLRVQIQYRIRVVNAIDIETYPDGFDPSVVTAQGPLSSPLTCNASFAPVPGNPGLWRAGNGDTAAQEQLLTVDGYTYGIPMFAVTRRNSSAFVVDSQTNGAGRSLANYISGMPSDRPDNLYSDWIVSDDILDLRHRIIPTENMKEICEDGFQRLTRGLIHGKMAKSTVGADHYSTVLMQVDAINPTSIAWAQTLPIHPDGSRRTFANASINQIDNFVVRTINQKSNGTIGGSWQTGDRVSVTAPSGAFMVSFDELWTDSLGVVPGPGPAADWTSGAITGDQTSAEVYVGTNPYSSILYGTTEPFNLTYTIRYPEGPNGFSQLPEAMLEARKIGTTLPIAMRDDDIRVRTANAVVASDGTHYTMLSYRGGATGEPYDFGHQMVYNILGNGTEYVTIPQQAYGYDVLGVARCQILNVDTAPSSIIRDGTNYSINVAYGIVIPTMNVQLSLYLGGKFFDTNKQGRGIVETYEMKEMVPDQSANGIRTSFTLTPSNQAIIALGSSHAYQGHGLAYVDGSAVELLTDNRNIYDSSKMHPITIDFAVAPGAGTYIEVPVLTRSAIGASEGYALFYKTVPYQGLLDSTVQGRIEAEGPAIITTAGSGAIANYTETTGQMRFNASTLVDGSGTSWLSTVKPGYIVKDGTKEYPIATVYSNTAMYLTGPADKASTWENYVIEAKDQPSFGNANIIDRLPALDTTNDSRGKNELISTAVSDGDPVLETRIISRTQDVMGLPPESVTFGYVSPTGSYRGRAAVRIDDAPLGLGNLGLKFEKLDSTGNYQKTYQTYILSDDGKLRLMVVGSETDNTAYSKFLNQASNSDVVDIFELPGRPITNK